MGLSALWVLALSAAGAPPLAGAPPDLGKIDRGIAKEPAYLTKAPRYALLVFGPEASHRVWLVLDGNTLYVDRNADGDLTGDRERVPAEKRDRTLDGEGGKKVPLLSRTWEVGEVASKDGETRHTELSLVMGKVGTAPDDWTLSVRPFGGHEQFARCGAFLFGPSPLEATVIHFGGPLTMHLFGWQPSAFDPKEYDLAVNVGARGVGKQSFASLATAAVPKGVHPIAELAFPGKKPGDPAVQVTVELPRRC